MIKLRNEKLFWNKKQLLTEKEAYSSGYDESALKKAHEGTMAYGILTAHNVGKTEGKLNLKFDKMASHDITYVGIIQTAKASGLKEFPMPYVLTNCHNSLCAVGGTINEDDHVFGLSAAKKYGGIFVPPHQAVIHTYMREMMSVCGGMILGSDSHTRYGALGTMAIGEGGPELVKQLLGKTYDVNYPEIIAVHLTGAPKHGVGPQDVAIAIIGAVFKNGFAKNKVLEFIGDGVDTLPVEFRNGVDVMTTETTCLSSIWKTDEKVKEYYVAHGRPKDFKYIDTGSLAQYDGAIEVDLGTVEPMIALPFHPSNAFTVKEVVARPYEILKEVEENGKKLLGNPNFRLTDKIENGKVKVSQGVIAGCAGGTFDNLYLAAQIMKGKDVGSGEFSLSVYPSSQPVYLDLAEKGAVSEFAKSGVIVKTAFCGPCFGAGDVPANNALSIRHTTRNFENREGSKPGDGQIASVALMDARSIAATAANHGYLTAATEVDYCDDIPTAVFDGGIYERRVYNGYKKAQTENDLKYGPNITDWPEIDPLPKNLALKFAAVITDPVTTTDELIPSGETSSYRSNPLRLAEFALSRKAPYYVGEAKTVKAEEIARKEGKQTEELQAVKTVFGTDEFGLASVIFATKPGDGSAREQAASCQRVLGGGANVAREYATKRYRSNLINWGMIPFLSEDNFEKGDILCVFDVREKISKGETTFDAKILRKGKTFDVKLKIDPLTEAERQIIVAGCLMNYYKNNK